MVITVSLSMNKLPELISMIWNTWSWPLSVSVAILSGIRIENWFCLVTFPKEKEHFNKHSFQNQSTTLHECIKESE